MHEHVIEVNNVSFSYEKEEILKSISISFHAGDFVALIGPNGAGKTTLAKIILGMLKPTAGTIRTHVPADDSCRQTIGYVPQTYSFDRLFPAKVNELFSACEVGHDSSELLTALAINDLMDKQFIELSGGQKQRVMTALALLQHPKVLILDEPSVGVDMETNEQFFSFLARINQKNKTTIIIITHDIGLVSKYAKTVVCVNKNLSCQGSVSELGMLLKKTYGKENMVIHHHEGKSC